MHTNKEIRLSFNQMTLAQKLGVCPATLAQRIKSGLISPDGIIVTGTRASFVFDAANLETHRAALLKTEPKEIL